MISKPELLLDACAELGEGPSWSANARLLYWVDILAGRLHIFDQRAKSDHHIDLGEPIGCLAPRRSGGLVLGLRSGFTLSTPPLFYWERGRG